MPLLLPRTKHSLHFHSTSALPVTFPQLCSDFGALPLKREGVPFRPCTHGGLSMYFGPGIFILVLQPGETSSSALLGPPFCCVSPLSLFLLRGRRRPAAGRTLFFHSFIFVVRPPSFAPLRLAAAAGPSELCSIHKRLSSSIPAHSFCPRLLPQLPPPSPKQWPSPARAISPGRSHDVSGTTASMEFSISMTELD